MAAALAQGTPTSDKSAQAAADSGRAVRPGPTALIGHTGIVYAIAFSPDGRRLASASQDRSVRIWDAQTGLTIGEPLLGHEGAVLSVTFSPDGRRLASASADQTIRLWDVETRRPIGKPLSGNAGAVRSVKFSPDGKRLVSGADDQSVRFWNAVSGEPIDAPLSQTGAVESVAFSPDGSRVASGSSDGSVRLWDEKTQRSLWGSPPSHDAAVRSVDFSPNGKRLVTASDDRTIHSWDIERGGLLSLALREPRHPVNSAAFSPDGKRLVVTTSTDPNVAVWNADTLTPLLVGFVEKRRAFDAKFSPSGDRIAAAYENAKILLWSVASPPRLTDVALGDRGDGFVVGEQGTAAHADAVLANLITTRTGTTDNLHAVAFAGGDHFAAVGEHGSILLLSSARNDVSRAKGPPDLNGVDLHAIAFQSGHGWAAGTRGTVLIGDASGENWTLQSRVTDATLRALWIQANNVGFAAGETPDGHWIALRAEDARDGNWQPLPHYPSPVWYFALGGLLPFAGLLNVMAFQRAPPPPPQSIASQAAAERPIRWRDPDRLRFKPLAISLSRFLRNMNTEPPLTVAITGRWGSGKSSMMNLVADDLERHGARPVRFNAWHHREEQHLLAAVFENIRVQAIPPLMTWPGLLFRVRLLILRTQLLLWTVAGVLLFLVIVLLIVRLGAPHLDPKAILLRLGGMDSLLLSEEIHKHVPKLESAVTGWLATLGGVGALGLLALWIRARVAPLPGAGALMASMSAKASLADFQTQLGFRYRFGVALGEVCGLLRVGGSPGLVILIDDLDRCQPDDVTKVLEAISFCVGAGPCTVVLGMDRRQVEFAVGQGFEKLVEGLPDDELDLARGVQPTPAMRRQAFARRYLEKLVNIEVPVPTLDEAGLERLLGSNVSAQASLAAAGLDQPIPEGPKWLAWVSMTLTTILQVARVMFLAILVGLMLLAGLSYQPSVPSVVGPRGADVTAAKMPLPIGPDSPAAERVSEPTPATSTDAFKPQLTDLEVKQLGADAGLGGGRWAWWGPAYVMVAFSALWLMGIAARRRDIPVRDSAKFIRALDAVEPLLLAPRMTPRLVKRFQNRMRYLAERMRQQQPDTDWAAGLLHWAGGLVGKEWVPAAWFAPAQSPGMPEEVLILLGAIEQFDPDIFRGAPSRLFDRLRESVAMNSERQLAWSKTMAAFRAGPDSGGELLEWPTEAHIRIYSDFVLPLLR